MSQRVPKVMRESKMQTIDGKFVGTFEMSLPVGKVFQHVRCVNSCDRGIVVLHN